MLVTFCGYDGNAPAPPGVGNGVGVPGCDSPFNSFSFSKISLHSSRTSVHPFILSSNDLFIDSCICWNLSMALSTLPPSSNINSIFAALAFPAIQSAPIASAFTATHSRNSLNLSNIQLSNLANTSLTAAKAISKAPTIPAPSFLNHFQTHPKAYANQYNILVAIALKFHSHFTPSQVTRATNATIKATIGCFVISVRAA